MLQIADGKFLVQVGVVLGRQFLVPRQISRVAAAVLFVLVPEEPSNCVYACVCARVRSKAPPGDGIGVQVIKPIFFFLVGGEGKRLLKSDGSKLAQVGLQLKHVYSQNDSRRLEPYDAKRSTKLTYATPLGSRIPSVRVGPVLSM